MKYSIYHGCLIPYRFPEYEKSAQIVLNALGVNLINIDDFSCCGSQIEESNDNFLLTLLASRNLAIAERAGVDVIITLCGSCTYVLKKIRLELQDEDLLSKINEKLRKDNLEYSGTVQIKHVLDFLHEDENRDSIAKHVITSIPARVALQVPCMISRPADISEFNLDPTQALADLLKPCGLKIIDYAYSKSCCGGTMLAFGEPTGKKLAQIRYSELKKLNIDFIVTACPNCQTVYGIYPDVLKEEVKPSIFFTQIIALAFGSSFEDVGLDRNHKKKLIQEKLVAISK